MVEARKKEENNSRENVISNSREQENMLKSGIYKHYSGKEYQFIGIAKHSETLEELVVYKSLYGDGQLWVRPLKMFVEDVEINGQKVSRFQHVDDSHGD